MHLRGFDIGCSLAQESRKCFTKKKLRLFMRISLENTFRYDEGVRGFLKRNLENSKQLMLCKVFLFQQITRRFLQITRRLSL